MPGASSVRMRCSVARRLLSCRSTKRSPLSSGEDERWLRSEPAEPWGVLARGGVGSKPTQIDVPSAGGHRGQTLKVTRSHPPLFKLG